MGSRLNNEIVCHFLYLLRLPQICSKEAFIAAKPRHPQSTQSEKPCLRQILCLHFPWILVIIKVIANGYFRNNTKTILLL